MKILQKEFASINRNRLIIFLALIKFIAPFLLQNHMYEPHRDEFLYLAEGHHMAWGYLELPPFMSALSYMTNIAGGSLFWIRFWPSLFGSLTYVIVGRLILLLGGDIFALLLGFLPFVFGYFVHVYFIFQPNFLEGFFWTLMAYGLILHVHTGKPKGLYLSGIALGLGMMSKYSISFFAISLFLGLLLTRERKIFFEKHFYFALLTSLIIFLPNLIWQYNHGFPEVYHLKELQRQQLQNVRQTDFLVDQLLFNLPCIFIWTSGWYWVAFTVSGKANRFIGWAAFFVILILVAGHGKSYYGMALYPILFGFGAVHIEKWTAGRRKYIRYIILIFTLLTGLYIDMIALPVLPPKQLASFYSNNSEFQKMHFLRWEDQNDHALSQDFADMLSWREMAEKIAKVYDSLDNSEKKQTILDCDNYGEAGAVDYYGPQFHLPPVVCHQANYLFWVPPDFYQSNIVILATDYPDVMQEHFVQEFQFAKVMDSITNPLAREYKSRIILLRGPSQKARSMWKAYYESLRKESRVD